MKTVLRGIRTTVSAVILVAAAVAPMTGYVTKAQSDAIKDAAIAVGLVMAADANQKRKGE